MMMRKGAEHAEELAEAIKGGHGNGVDKLVSAYKLIGGAFAAGEPPVDWILDRAGERAVFEPALAGRTGTRRFAWRFAVIAGMAAALVVAVILAKPGPPSAKTIISKAMAAIEQPNMITYYKITGSIKTPFGVRSYTDEHWVDYKNEREKSVYKSGDAKNESFTLTKDGTTIGIEKAGDSIDVGESKALTPFSDRLKDSIMRYREQIKSGRAKRIGEETIDDVATYKILITAEPPQDVGRVDKRKMVMVETINVRKDNFMPVREVSERLLVTEEGLSTVDTAETSMFSGVELIAPATLGPNFFSLDIPKNAPYHYSYGFMPAEAKEFKEFDLYYLGDSFAGFNLAGGFEYYKEANQNRPKGLPESRVKLDYTNAANDDGINIMIWPKFDLSVLINASYPSGKKSALDINGNQGVLIETNWGRQVTRVILLQLGRSSLQIEANDKATLIDAAKHLIKINQ